MNTEREAHFEILADAMLASLDLDPHSYGRAWGQDVKRPYGNSDLAGDIAEMIGLKPAGTDEGSPVFTDEQMDYCNELNADLGEWLLKKWRERKP